jgi:hypothetical protein
MINEIDGILAKGLDSDEETKNKNLQKYLMNCRKSFISYNIDPNDVNRFTNKEMKNKFKEKASKYSIEDITFNKLSLMILRDYLEMFFKDMKSQLGRDNFTIKIANNYDNMM